MQSCPSAWRKASDRWDLHRGCGYGQQAGWQEAQSPRGQDTSTRTLQVSKNQRRRATWAEGTRRVGGGAQEPRRPSCCEGCWHFGARSDVHQEGAEALRQDRRPGSGAAFSSAAFPGGGRAPGTPLPALSPGRSPPNRPELCLPPLVSLK